MRKKVSRLVFWIGMALIGVLAVPAAVLLCVICCMVRMLDLVMKKIGRE